MEKTLKRYYWDSEGRKHIPLDDEDQDQDTASMYHMRRSARRARRWARRWTWYVFKTFDTSNDGFLTLPELAKALLSLGVKLPHPLSWLCITILTPMIAGACTTESSCGLSSIATTWPRRT